MMHMDTPDDRAEFERRFSLLHQQLVNGKLHVAQSALRSMAGLLRVRYLPNGRFDFLSVDESARLLANMAGQFHEDCLKELLKQKTAQENDSESKKSTEPGYSGSDENGS
jgi:hypothetical protein